GKYFGPLNNATQKPPFQRKMVSHTLTIIYTRIVHKIIVKTIVVTPCSNVAAVWALYASVTFIPLNCVTTQKKLSFTWLTVIAPAPIAMTTSASGTAPSTPSEGKRGATKVDVMTSAAV